VIRIGIIGSGSVAQALGRALHDRGSAIVALSAREPDRAARAAAFIGPDVQVLSLSDIPWAASHLIVAVSDDAITSVAERLGTASVRGAVVVHTCGARGPEALAPVREAGAAAGVLHPLQTVPSPALGVARLHRITFGIGGDPAAVAWAEQIASALDSRALRITDEGFPAYHTAAAIAGNGLTALLDSAVLLMQQAGVDADAALGALAPLLRATLENVVTAGTVAALTGPVARGDAATIREHLGALREAPGDVRDLYLASSRRLLELARRRGLDEAAAREVERLLDAAVSEPGATKGLPASVSRR
jgi:predicted short-subunit dehydrogenase-like oxidoreductase (DUF2520 family)